MRSWTARALLKSEPNFKPALRSTSSVTPATRLRSPTGLPRKQKIPTGFWTPASSKPPGIRLACDHEPGTYRPYQSLLDTARHFGGKLQIAGRGIQRHARGNRASMVREGL